MAKRKLFMHLNLSLGVALILILGSCTPKKLLQKGDYKQITNINDINELLKQLERVDSVEDKAAAKILTAANKGVKIAEEEGPEAAAEHTSWAMAAKDYSESIAIKPTTEALMGYAKAYAMSGRTLSSKLENFKKTIEIYLITLELGKRTQKPLSLEQQKQVEANITCLEAFIKQPQPKVPICQLVRESLRVGNIAQ